MDLPAPEGPTTATVCPAGTSKLIPFMAAAVIGEMHVLEDDGAGGDDERLGALDVLDLGIDLQQLEHLLDIRSGPGGSHDDETDEVERD